MTVSTQRREHHYTQSDDPRLEELISDQLDAICCDIRASLPPEALDAIVLGGGYGRGEGGALSTPAGLRPYNDYDLVLIHHLKNDRRVRKVLQRIHEEHSRNCNIHVDVTPVRYRDLPRLPLTLTWFELQAGHQVLYGPRNILREMGRRRLAELPRSEWGRLLFNRASGILFSIWGLEGKPCSLSEGESWESFTTRQVNKAWLALGDVMLAEQGLYHPSVLRRRDVFQRVCASDFADAYIKATSFKLHPHLTEARAALIPQLAALASRLSDKLQTLPTSEPRAWVGLYSTARLLRPSRWALSRPWRYPRERLQLALIAELRGNSLPRLRYVGSSEDYVRLWEHYA